MHLCGWGGCLSETQPLWVIHVCVSEVALFACSLTLASYWDSSRASQSVDSNFDSASFHHNYCIWSQIFLSAVSGQREVTVRRNAGPRCPSTSPPGPWQLLGQWKKRGSPMAPPALLDGRHPPSCSCGCRGRCYGCRGRAELSKWAAGGTVRRCSMVPCHPPRPHHLPRPPRFPPASARGRTEDSWTGCCRRKDLSTDVRSTQSSERGSSRDFQPDTRFTGEKCASYSACWSVKSVTS